MDKDEYESSGTDMKVKDVLETVANTGRVGNLAVEPASLVVREPGMPCTICFNIRSVNIIPISSSVVSEPSTYEDDEYGSGLWAGTKLYIVIACISALVLVAIVQATCTLCKMRSKTAKNQVKVQTLWALWFHLTHELSFRSH